MFCRLSTSLSRSLIALLLLRVASAEAADEIAIEVPLAGRYQLSAERLLVEDQGGASQPIAAPVTLQLCGEALCAPFAAAPLPLKLHGEPNLGVNGRQLKGSVWALVRDGALVLVNRLPLEEYLVATVGSEMPKAFPLEALKAQAVAARTFALQRMVLREGAVAHVRSSTLDQVYGGLAHESGETRAAVTATAGQVLVAGRQPIEAFFFSSCDGHTRAGAAVFGEGYEQFRSVPCASCKLQPKAVWRATQSLSELSRKLGTKVRSLALDGQAEDGRAAAVVVTPGGRRIAPEALRKLIGYTVLKSASFKLSCSGAACVFEGLGYGHGVGMCQWGAKAMADEGRSYTEILAHYYPHATLKTLR